MNFISSYSPQKIWGKKLLRSSTRDRPTSGQSRHLCSNKYGHPFLPWRIHLAAWCRWRVVAELRWILGRSHGWDRFRFRLRRFSFDWHRWWGFGTCIFMVNLFTTPSPQRHVHSPSSDVSGLSVRKNWKVQYWADECSWLWFLFAIVAACSRLPSSGTTLSLSTTHHKHVKNKSPSAGQ